MLRGSQHDAESFEYVATIHTELPTRSSLKSSVLLLAPIKSAHQESMRVKLSLGFDSMIQTSTSQWTHEKTTTIIRLLDKYFSAKENNNNTSETKNTIDILYIMYHLQCLYSTYTKQELSRAETRLILDSWVGPPSFCRCASVGLFFWLAVILPIVNKTCQLVVLLDSNPQEKRSRPKRGNRVKKDRPTWANARPFWLSLSLTSLYISRSS
jgi:hypothetical protein